MTLWRLKKLQYLSGCSVLVRVSYAAPRGTDDRIRIAGSCVKHRLVGVRLWHLRLSGDGCRVQALRRDGVRLTIYANDPSPTVEIITWASDSMANLDPLD
jgi:hypothetical protein